MPWVAVLEKKFILSICHFLIHLNVLCVTGYERITDVDMVVRQRDADAFDGLQEAVR